MGEGVSVCKASLPLYLFPSLYTRFSLVLRQLFSVWGPICLVHFRVFANSFLHGQNILTNRQRNIQKFTIILTPSVYLHLLFPYSIQPTPLPPSFAWVTISFSDPPPPPPSSPDYLHPPLTFFPHQALSPASPQSLTCTYPTPLRFSLTHLPYPSPWSTFACLFPFSHSLVLS